MGAVRDRIPKFLQPRYKNRDKQTIGEEVRKAMKEDRRITLNKLVGVTGRANSSVATYYHFFKRNGLDAEL